MCSVRQGNSLVLWALQVESPLHTITCPRRDPLLSPYTDSTIEQDDIRLLYRMYDVMEALNVAVIGLGHWGHHYLRIFSHGELAGAAHCDAGEPACLCRYPFSIRHTWLFATETRTGSITLERLLFRQRSTSRLFLRTVALAVWQKPLF